MTAAYPFDPDVREHVARLLYELLPALYRARDESSGDLQKLLRVLAAPLSELRQNIEELHGDLFIDTCSDRIIPYLAEMVGVTLGFPDAASNRRDVRGTVGWRRRKGTPGALEEMAADLSGQMVVTQEGWKRLLVAQDLNLLRPDRTVTNVRPPTLAESARGPLDSAFHAVDLRGISTTNGRYHPAHVVHWIHPTRLFPVRDGTAFDRTRRDAEGKPTDPDLRFAFQPLGATNPLRIRREPLGRAVQTDRVPPQHFARAVGAYFDQTGDSRDRFSVRLSGLPAAVAVPVRELRQPSVQPAHPALTRTRVCLDLLEGPRKVLTSDIRVDVYTAELNADGKPAMESALWRGGAIFKMQGEMLPVAGDAVFQPSGAPVALLRLRGAVAGAAVYFPGAVVELSSSAVDALHASTVPRLAVEGFLRGALIVEIPGTWVHGDRWFYLAVDGSVYEAQSEGGGMPNLALDEAEGMAAFRGAALAVGPGPAWPPLGRHASSERMTRVPCAPGRGPVMLHAGPVRRRVGEALHSFSETVRMGLTFAARITKAGGAQYHPFLRLRWAGSNPLGGNVFEVLDASGAPIAAGTYEALVMARAERLRHVAALREQQASDVALVVRFEAELLGLVLPPCEVTFTTDDGQTILIHLPSLETVDDVGTDWATSPAPWDKRSIAVSVSTDGSTRHVDTNRPVRYALGPVAPLQTATLRRRRVHYRNLCAWDREDPTAKPPKMLAPVPPGHLDVDPEHGLFALAKTEPPRAFPPTTGVPARMPCRVTVDFLDGYSDHIGARPDAREPLLNRRQPEPTRLVSASGKLHAGVSAKWHGKPRHASLAEALAAVAQAMAEMSGPAMQEVIQFEDSATYVESQPPEWPLPPPGKVVSLALQAAEGHRPVLVWNGPWASPGGEAQDAQTGFYESLTLRGLALSCGDVQIPAARRVAVEFCTIINKATSLELRAPPGMDTTIHIERCITAAIVLLDSGTLRIHDSVVDAGARAIDVPHGRCELEHVTVLSSAGHGPHDHGTVAFALEASESIFVEKVKVLDRFQGCIRYSRVEPGSILPRRHRVVEIPVRFVSSSRHDPAHARLAPDCAPEIARGAEDGSEMGAFYSVRFAQRQSALARRLADFTPAGLSTGIIRID